MKVKNSFNLLVAGLVLTFAVTGCHPRQPVGVTVLHGSKTGAPIGPGPGELIGNDTGKPETTAFTQSNNPDRTGWKEDRDTFKADTVYFDYDSTAIKSG